MILLTSTHESDIPMPSSGTRDDAEFVTDLELAIVVPTFNEIDNIETLIAAIQVALEGHDYEIIIVDDSSPDGTAIGFVKLPSAIPESVVSSGSGAVG